MLSSERCKWLKTRIVADIPKSSPNIKQHRGFAISYILFDHKDSSSFFHQSTCFVHLVAMMWLNAWRNIAAAARQTDSFILPLFIKRQLLAAMCVRQPLNKYHLHLCLHVLSLASKIDRPCRIMDCLMPSYSTKREVREYYKLITCYLLTDSIVFTKSSSIKQS